jgi:hypothetical protein
MAPIVPVIMAVTMAASAATSIIGAVKGGPDMPKSPAATDTAKKSQQELESAYAQNQLMRRRSGASSTILTGPQGVQTSNQGTHTTLGG